MLTFGEFTEQEEAEAERMSEYCQYCAKFRKAAPNELKDAPEGYEWGYCELQRAYVDGLGC